MYLEKKKLFIKVITLTYHMPTDLRTVLHHTVMLAELDISGLNAHVVNKMILKLEWKLESSCFPSM
uniref:Uncharacterized protein n=1 Tax=Arundo donax TaxID=35708 RepID=A0A0A9FKW8_ARUDO